MSYFLFNAVPPSIPCTLLSSTVRMVSSAYVPFSFSHSVPPAFIPCFLTSCVVSSFTLYQESLTHFTSSQFPCSHTISHFFIFFHSNSLCRVYHPIYLRAVRQHISHIYLPASFRFSFIFDIYSPADHVTMKLNCILHYVSIKVCGGRRSSWMDKHMVQQIQ